MTSEKKRVTRLMKHQGSIYEAQFIAAAMSSGLHVLSPLGDYLPYDVIVSPNHKTFHRVQVKGTAFLQKHKKLTYKVVARHVVRGVTKTLTPDATDFLAVLIAPVNVWYHIPAENVASITLSFRPQVENTTSQYEIWKEAWNVYH